MAAKADFELDINGLNELMKSPEMEAALQNAGNAVANIANGNYGVRVHQASFVAIANVYAEDKESAIAAKKDGTLTRALSSAGLKM